MHLSKWSSIQWGTILKISFRGIYLKLHSNLANCAIWNIFQVFSVINVFWYLKNVRAVFMFENCLIRENLKSDKTISNRPATARFEIFLSGNLFVISFCINKMGMINMLFLVKTISILFKSNKFHLKSHSAKPRCAIWNIGSSWTFYSVMPWKIMHFLFAQHFHNYVS